MLESQKPLNVRESLINEVITKDNPELIIDHSRLLTINQDIRKVIFRNPTLNDLEKACDFQLRVWSKDIRGTKDEIRKRFEIFPEGCVIALAIHGSNNSQKEGEIVGMVTTQRVNIPQEEIDAMSWNDSTGDGNIDVNFDPEGETIEAISLAVDEKYRKNRIGSTLLLCSLKIAALLNNPPIKYFSLNARVPYYKDFVDGWKKNYFGKPEINEYFTRHKNTDPVLRTHMTTGGIVVTDSYGKIREVKGQESDIESAGMGIRFRYDLTLISRRLRSIKNKM